ncbi:hypothetical protein [Calothrix sp. 336/3]|uniref:hypothetical protein n=1 Tax=Calothrix sp. 336/3 TaxID=1337936 RepID=UPI0004E2D4A8|nr:hypothetical protein [Calothrix sp. 336/3]AKG21589.1 hypothetical protein IJ00_10160 [Calothrix sp. 336/3]
MIKLSKEQILEFLAELAAPVSPEIFAGFGSEFQRNRYEWEKQNQELEKEEEYISVWIKEQEVQHTLDILLEIAHNPPERDFYDGIAQRRQLDWEYYLALIIYQLGIRDRVLLISKLEANNDNINSIIASVKEYLADD